MAPAHRHPPPAPDRTEGGWMQQSRYGDRSVPVPAEQAFFQRGVILSTCPGERKGICAPQAASAHILCYLPQTRPWHGASAAAGARGRYKGGLREAPSSGALRWCNSKRRKRQIPGGVYRGMVPSGFGHGTGLYPRHRCRAKKDRPAPRKGSACVHTRGQGKSTAWPSAPSGCGPGRAGVRLRPGSG